MGCSERIKLMVDYGGRHRRDKFISMISVNIDIVNFFKKQNIYN